MQTEGQHRAKQTDSFIKLFERNPIMNSLQLQKACLEIGILNSTARKSDAEKLGYEWEVSRIEGSRMFSFKYLGHRDPGQLQLFKAA